MGARRQHVRDPGRSFLPSSPPRTSEKEPQAVVQQRLAVHGRPRGRAVLEEGVEERVVEGVGGVGGGLGQVGLALGEGALQVLRGGGGNRDRRARWGSLPSFVASWRKRVEISDIANMRCVGTEWQEKPPRSPPRTLKIFFRAFMALWKANPGRSTGAAIQSPLANVSIWRLRSAASAGVKRRCSTLCSMAWELMALKAWYSSTRSRALHSVRCCSMTWGGAGGIDTVVESFRITSKSSERRRLTTDFLQRSAVAVENGFFARRPNLGDRPEAVLIEGLGREEAAPQQADALVLLLVGQLRGTGESIASRSQTMNSG